MDVRERSDGDGAGCRHRAEGAEAELELLRRGDIGLGRAEIERYGSSGSREEFFDERRRENE